jgi:hypothetical protein
MAQFSRRPDGLVDLEGAPPGLALSDEQLTRLGHTPAAPPPPKWAQQLPAVPEQLRGPAPGATAQLFGPASPQPGAEYGFNKFLQVPDARPVTGEAGASVSPGVQQLMAGTKPAELTTPTTEDVRRDARKARDVSDTKSKVSGFRSDLPDGPTGSPGGAQAPRGGGGGGRVIKGGIQLAGYKQEMGLPLSDQDVTDAVALKRTQLEQTEQGAAHRLRAETKATEKEANELAFERSRLAGEREKRKLVDDEIRAAESTFRQREEELSNIETPKMKQFWADKGIQGRIGGAIAVIAGGMRAGFQGNAQNNGMNMLNDIYDRWAAEKREEYERQKDGAARSRTRWGQLIDLYGTPEEADKALRAEAAIVVNKQIENQKRLDLLPAQIADLSALQAQNGQEVIKLRGELLQARAGRVEKTFVNRPDQFVGPAVRKPNPEARQRQFRLRDGSTVFHKGTPAERAADENNYMANARIANAASRLQKLRTKPGAKTDPEVRGQIEAASAELFIALKDGANLGTLDKGSLEFRNEWTGDANALIDMGGADAKLGEVSRAAEGRLHDTEYHKLTADEHGEIPLHDAGPQGVEER